MTGAYGPLRAFPPVRRIWRAGGRDLSYPDGSAGGRNHSEHCPGGPATVHGFERPKGPLLAPTRKFRLTPSAPSRGPQTTSPPPPGRGVPSAWPPRERTPPTTLLPPFRR